MRCAQCRRSVPFWKPRVEGLFCSTECEKGFYADEAPPPYRPGPVERALDPVLSVLKRPFLHCNQCLRPIPMWNTPVEGNLCSQRCAEDRVAGKPEKLDENRGRRAHEFGNIMKGLGLIPLGLILSVTCFPAWAILCLIGVGLMIMGTVNWAQARPWAPHMAVPEDTPSSDYSSNGYGGGSTYTSVTASCGRCGRSVPSHLTAGDSCPHCAAYWSAESRKGF